MKVLQINTYYQYGSTGRIVFQLMKKQNEQGIISAAIYGRKMNESLDEHVICIQSKGAFLISKWCTHIWGKHGFYSKRATKKAIKFIDKYQPDVIHLHNLHGHYINLELLLNAIAARRIPVLWTLHDCWAFTGHCAHFHAIGCEKWKTGCGACQLKRQYPRSLFFDRSSESWKEKRDLIETLPVLKIITVSKWLESLVLDSFLCEKEVETIYNWVDCAVFKRDASADEMRNKLNLKNKRIILAAAPTWTARKGINDIFEMASFLERDEVIVVVGDVGKRTLPVNVVNLDAVKDPKILAMYYSMADVFINPSYQETFGLTTAEALACGTPAVVYDVTACPEVVGNDRFIGGAVPCGDVKKLLAEARRLYKLNGFDQQIAARRWVEDSFSPKEQLDKYVQQYELLYRSKKHQTE